MRRLPPLNALRAFEASARHLSFSRAADELAVTPAAISHQVRQLEDWFGVPLFRRLNRAVRLTDAGQACLPLLTDGFDMLARAAAAVGATDDAGMLTVSVAPSFAGKWLVPRIEGFSARHPDIDVRISASMALVDFRTDDVDVGIRFGLGNYPDLRVDKLFAESVTPMCSPSLMAGGTPLDAPADLRHFTLLHDDSAYAIGPIPDWRMWLRLAGVEDVVDWRRGPRFNQSEHALQAAIDGLGVVIGRNYLARADLAAGRLVQPFALTLPTDFGYFVVAPEATADWPKVRAFRNWIVEETCKDTAGAGTDTDDTEPTP